MKVVILAGGLGSRLAEETKLIPKPMVEIGGKPILWHIMKIYSHYGFNDFIILTGYKQEIIKNYFANYYINNSDITFDLEQNKIILHSNYTEPWKVTVFFTGHNTMTGSRIRKVKHLIGDQRFMLTYGDGVSDVNIQKLLEFHEWQGKLCTLTSVQPVGRFGAVETAENGLVTSFEEKPKGDGSWINGGFMVCEPGIFEYIPEGEDIVWEQEPLKKICADGELAAFHHDGFWKSMDTLKDKHDLNAMWAENKSSWKIWEI